MRPSDSYDDSFLYPDDDPAYTDENQTVWEESSEYGDKMPGQRGAIRDPAPRGVRVRMFLFFLLLLAGIALLILKLTGVLFSGSSEPAASNDPVIEGISSAPSSGDGDGNAPSPGNGTSMDCQDTEENFAALSEPFYSDESLFLAGIRLSADRTACFVGEEGSFTLTIEIPAPYASLLQTREETVTINGADGTVLHSISLADFASLEDGSLKTTCSMSLDTSQFQTQSLRARCGSYYSPALSVSVISEITGEMVASCAMIGAELNSEIAAHYADQDAVARAHAAKDWLSKDARILSTDFSADETIVYYITADHVCGAYNAAGLTENADPKQDISGIGDGDSTRFDSESTLSSLYQTYGETEIPDTDSVYPDATRGSSISTRNDALLLIPCPSHMGVGAVDYERQFTNDVTSYASAVNGNAVIYREMDAVRAVFSGELCRYGFLTLFTHGSIMDGQFYRDHNKDTIYLMYRSDAFTDDTKDAVHQDALDVFQEMKDAALEFDPDGHWTAWGFSNAWFAEPWDASMWQSIPKMILTTIYSNSGDQYEILATSGFLMNWYESCHFDNTLVYLAACKGLLNRDFDEWLINRGCRVVYGFAHTVRTIANAGYHELLTARMTEASSHFPTFLAPSREASEAIGTADSIAGALAGEAVWFTWISELSASYHAANPAGLTDNTLYYVGSGDISFAGNAALTGHVMLQETDAEGNPLPGVDPVPAEGAEVTAYHLMNRQFISFGGNKTVTGQDGSFSCPAVPAGYLIFKASLENDESDAYGIYLADAVTDGGTITIPVRKKSVVNNGGEVIGYKGNTYYWRYHAESFSKDGIFAGFDRQKVNNALIERRPDGTETVLLEADGFGDLYIENDVLYYEKSDYGIGTYSLADGSTGDFGYASMIGADKESGALFYTTNGVLYAMFEGRSITLRSENYAAFLGSRGGTAYYAVISETTSSYDAVQVCGYDFSGDKGETLLGTFRMEHDFMGGCMLSGACDENAAYVAAVPCGGTGLFCWDGGLFRIPFDGSGVTELVSHTGSHALGFDGILLTKQDEKTWIHFYDGEGVSLAGGNLAPYLTSGIQKVDAESGSVSSSDQVLTKEHHYFEGGNLYVQTDGTGEETLLLSADQLASLGFAGGGNTAGSEFTFAPAVDILDGEVYVRLEQVLANGSDFGWRPGFDRIRGSRVRVSLTDGTVETVNSY